MKKAGDVLGVRLWHKITVSYISWILVAIMLAACGSIEETAQVLNKESTASASNYQRYNTIRDGSLLNPDGSEIHQLYFYTQHAVEPVLALLKSELGKPQSEAPEFLWVDLNVREWSEMPVQLMINVSRFRGSDDEWFDVQISAATKEKIYCNQVHNQRKQSDHTFRGLLIRHL